MVDTEMKGQNVIELMNKTLRYGRQLLKALLLVELVYLILVNGILWLPLTQDVVKKKRPWKVFLSEARASGEHS